MSISLLRSRWAALGAALAVSVGAGGVGLVNAALDSGEKPVTITVAPKRVLDTRVDLGLTGAFRHAVPRDVQITGPVVVAAATGTATETVVPTDAVGVLVNVTVLRPSGRGYLSLRPGGAAGVPTTSTVNFEPGVVAPNAATVDLAGGEVQVFVYLEDGGTAHVLIDIVGYTIDHTHDDRYDTSSEVDAKIAAIPTGPQGPEGPQGPQGPAPDYANVIVVAKSGGDFTSVTAAMDSITSASESNRYLVWVAPGVYETEDVTMQPYVDIQGSGQGVTVLRSVRDAAGFGPDAATLVGAENAELRHVTVEAEAAPGGNWSHAIYTASGTSFTHVTAISTGGARSRGIFVDSGASANMVDVVMVANDASVSNIGLDVYQGVVLADGVFADAAGGTVAKAILIVDAASEVQIENVTAHATGGSSTSHGVETANSSVTLEGLRSVVNGPSSSAGLVCGGVGHRVRIVGAAIHSESSTGPLAARGVRGVDCNLEVRNAVIDAVAGSGQAVGIDHMQVDGVTPADVTIAGVESRATSAGSSAIGLAIASTGTPAGTFGRVTDLVVRATGGSGSLNSWGILHGAVGEVRYRGLSITAEGAANFMYGIQASRGLLRFDDVVVDAVAEASTTVFGVELLADGASLTNARVRAVNAASGDSHDAVGIKANNAIDVTFADVGAYAEAETNVWGVDVTGASVALTRVSATAVGVPGSVVYGARCFNGGVDIHDSVLHAGVSDVTARGIDLYNCAGTANGTEMTVDAGATGAYGFVANGNNGTTVFTVRDGFIAGADNSVLTEGDAKVLVVASSLDGGAGSSGSLTDTQECTAVTYNSAGGEAFQAGSSDPCP